MAESSIYFAPRCLFCNKNNKRRHTRRGRTWKCEHCGEFNPGPGMIRAMVGRFTTPPAGAHASQNAVQDVAAPKRAVTKIKGNGQASQPVKDRPVKAEKPAEPASAEPVDRPKKRGVLDVIYG